MYRITVVGTAVKNLFWCLKEFFLENWRVIRPEIQILHQCLGKIVFRLQDYSGPGCHCSVGWASSRNLKCCWVNSQSGNMLGVQDRSPIGGLWEASNWCFSPSLYPSLPPLSKNTIFKKLKKKIILLIKLLEKGD